MTDYLLYGLYRFLKTLLRILPGRAKTALIRLVAKTAYALDGKHRRIIQKNLAFFMGDRLSPARQRQVSKAVFERFGRYLIDVIEHDYRSKEALAKLVRVENDAAIREAIARGERIIILAAHYGHWELIGQYLCAFYRTFVGIAQRFSNSGLLTKELQRYRERSGMEILPKRGAMRGIAQALKAGKMVGFLPDQSTKTGVKVEFFGRELLWLESASRLAKQFDAVIFPTFMTTDDFKTYTLFFLDPIRPDATLEKEADIERMAKLEALSLQRAIERNPEEYFWFHKRMKREIKGFYEG